MDFYSYTMKLDRPPNEILTYCPTCKNQKMVLHWYKLWSETSTIYTTLIVMRNFYFHSAHFTMKWDRPLNEVQIYCSTFKTKIWFSFVLNFELLPKNWFWYSLGFIRLLKIWLKYLGLMTVRIIKKYSETNPKNVFWGSESVLISHFQI